MSAPAPHRGFARLAVVTAVLTLVLIALGGTVRATGNGLACPTWPGCFSAGDFVPAWQLGVWLEHTHRLVAGVVGLLIAAQLVWVLVRFRDRPALLWPTVAAAVAVNVQAGLGALVVLHLLRAELVTAHLGLGMLVLACELYLALAAHPAPPPTGAGADSSADAGAVPGADARVARLALAVAALAYVQILVGGHLTGVAGGLAYRRFPLLGIATFAPIANEAQLFNVLHRVLAFGLAVAVAVLVVRVRRTSADPWLRRTTLVVAHLVALQILLGVANIWSGLSFLTVVPHLAVASWIWAGLVLTAARASSRVPVLAPARSRRALEVAA